MTHPTVYRVSIRGQSYFLEAGFLVSLIDDRQVVLSDVKTAGGTKSHIDVSSPIGWYSTMPEAIEVHAKEEHRRHSEKMMELQRFADSCNSQI